MNRRIGRALLNSLPEWALFVLAAGGAALLAAGGLLLVDRLLGSLRDEPSGGTVSTVASMVMTLFALVLAFTVVNLDSSYQDASKSVRDEANALSQIVSDMKAFPPPARAKVAKAAARYVNEVRLHEFPAMRAGKLAPRGQDAVDGLFSTLQTIEPTTHAQRGFYQAAAGALTTLAADRRDRIAATDSALPQAFWVLIILTALLSIVMTLFIRAHRLAVDMVMVAAVASVVGVGLLTTLLLEYPFSGSIAVTSTPFLEGSLGQLPGVVR